MATYFILANWTEQGIKNVKDTIDRANHFRSICEQHGVKVVSLHWTQGRYDNIAVVEAPDESTMIATVLASSRMGSIRTETLRALTEGEMFSILQKV